MSNVNPSDSKYMFWLGLPFIFAGGAIVARSIELYAINSSSSQWVGIAFGVMFYNAGVSIGLLDSFFNRFRESTFFSYTHLAAILSIFLIFPLLFNWVAFGAGKREFSMSISIPFLSFDGPANEVIGRIFFAIPALIMDAVIGYLAYAFVKERLWRKKDDDINAYIEEMSVEKEVKPYKEKAS
ncbi:MAG: hypothetical protein HN392_04700 [Anaerolineae bacterium]|jgi:hypothetical protein|nr:hypothetical protein [Anaerolineae bacterium]MBT7781757.1 hypothetical protein [Anaerolineae bacterium]